MYVSNAPPRSNRPNQSPYNPLKLLTKVFNFATSIFAYLPPIPPWPKNQLQFLEKTKRNKHTNRLKINATEKAEQDQLHLTRIEKVEERRKRGATYPTLKKFTFPADDPPLTRKNTTEQQTLRSYWENIRKLNPQIKFPDKKKF